MTCPHNDLHYNLNFQSFGDTNIKYIELSGYCKLCKKKIKFQGRKYGMSADA